MDDLETHSNNDWVEPSPYVNWYEQHLSYCLSRILNISRCDILFILPDKFISALTVTKTNPWDWWYWKFLEHFGSRPVRQVSRVYSKEHWRFCTGFLQQQAAQLVGDFHAWAEPEEEDAAAWLKSVCSPRRVMKCSVKVWPFSWNDCQAKLEHSSASGRFSFFFLPPNEKCKKQNCLTPITPPMGAEELAGECGRQRLPGHLSGKIIYDKEAKRPEVS